MFFAKGKKKSQISLFDPLEYGEIIKDERIQTNNVMFRPKEEGIKLLIKHYRKKWKTSIDQIEKEVNAEELSEKLKAIREDNSEEKDCRVATLFATDAIHTYTVIYLKENGQEGFLLFDSAGLDSHRNSCLWLNKMQCFEQEDFPPIYSVLEASQADRGSCTTLALNIAVDTTSKRKGEYIIPNLLKLLYDNKQSPDRDQNEPYLINPKNEEKFFKVRLPESLARGIQISESLPKFTSQFVHKNQTLKEFREKYQLLTKNQDGVEKSIAGFVKIKGITTHLSNIARWHYLSELVKIHGKNFDQKMQNQFLNDAKELIKDKYQEPITSADEIKIDMYSELRELALQVHEKLSAPPEKEQTQPATHSSHKH